ncbi:DUF4350 domain-containing protein [Flavobacterium urocaniciphilum]|uniref:DUF4350 domain-containing protein n=1 Tax=Flavobacterium urocaniciphilum TaxID=1299341 RepID=A0A1H8YZ43_9FLAO|nr:DUF4350 domain-containing protein [Flavobacterium urocaniciphilum]SEP57479.1 hypothetical protein SAMN05444005_101380 [Flavobacterium urocaniciphilum]
MSKNIKILIFFLVFVLALIIFADSNKTKPINWNATFGLNDKIPFGLKVFNEESKSLFKNQNLEKFSETPYEFFNKDMVFTQVITEGDTITSYNTNTSKKGTVFAISELNKFDKSSMEELLKFAREGNTIFISATNFSEVLSDSLKFEVHLKNSDNLPFKNALVNQDIYYPFEKGAKDFYFHKFDKTTTKILGNLVDRKYILPNYIEVKHGKGKFLLHLQPIAFTNYYLLKNNFKYIESVCSHIDSKNIYWNVDGIEESSISSNPLRFIFSQPGLKWAWYFGLIGILIFMLFNAKRRQRIIPISEPVKNTTVEFAKTIGNLYFLEKNHKDIADKKIVYFLEKIRKDYYLDTTVLDETFINRLHQKTSKEKADIIKIINKINYIKNSSIIVEKDLVELNTLIEKLNL